MNTPEKGRISYACEITIYFGWISTGKRYNIYYQDETWMNKNMAPNKIWKYGEDGAVHYKVPSGKGERSIISHVGSATTGLLLDACFLCAVRKATRGKTIIRK